MSDDHLWSEATEAKKKNDEARIQFQEKIRSMMKAMAEPPHPLMSEETRRQVLLGYVHDLVGEFMAKLECGCCARKGTE